MTYIQQMPIKISLLISLTLACLSTATLLLTPEARAEQTPLWLDVRSLEEYQAGHVEGATLIPHSNINADSAAVLGSKDRMVYVYCRSGGRAGIAKQTLQELGFTRVTNLGGLAEARAHYQQHALDKQ